MIKMIRHKTSQNVGMKLHIHSVSNNNTIPNPRPHDNVVTKTEHIYRHKDGTNRRHTARTNIPSQRQNSITITKMGAKIPMSHKL